MTTKVTVIPSTIDPLTQLPRNSKEKIKVAAYARVSTNSEEQNTSYEAQVNYYQNYIENKYEWAFVGVYADEGISGTNTKRRASFNRMIEDALDGKINLIITKSISRFARNTLDTIKFVRKLKDKGVEVFFEKENLWTLNSKSELILTIMASIAQEESRSISQNVTWGKRVSFQNGKVSFAYSRFLGYEKKDGKIVIVEEEAKVVRLIYRMFLVEGQTPIAIRNYLTEQGIKTAADATWRAHVILSILTNEKYKGDALLQKKYTENFLEQKMVKNTGQVPQYYVENSHPAIIDKDMWEMVQIEIKRRREMVGGFSSANLFAGKIKCADCGGYYGRKTWHSNSKYRRSIYRCNKKYEEGKDKCKTPHLSEEEIKEKFLNAYNITIKDRERVKNDLKEVLKLITSTKGIDKEIKEIDAELITLTESINKLIQDNSKTKSGIDEFDKRLKELRVRYDDLRARKEELANLKRENSAKSYRIKKFIANLEKSTDKLKDWNSELWMLTVESATVYRDKRIKFKFYDGIANK
ncbi:MAG TPA: recombinase family protein [Acholeplasmataceae bacterium]|nr:recombinase family protein [Acholeplasmataceae bacterium]